MNSGVTEQLPLTLVFYLNYLTEFVARVLFSSKFFLKFKHLTGVLAEGKALSPKCTPLPLNTRWVPRGSRMCLACIFTRSLPRNGEPGVTELNEFAGRWKLCLRRIVSMFLAL